MTDEKRSWRVTCRHFASAALASEDDAKKHLALIKDKGCKDYHRVEYTEIPYGSRSRA